MAKTITELSKELSISRQAIHQSLDKILDKDKIKMKGNAYVFNSKQEKLIIEFFSSGKETETSTESSTELIKLLQSQNDFLKQELNESKTQLERAYEEKKELMKLLDQQQRLSLQSSQKIEKLESNIESYEELDMNKHVEPVKNKKWYHIFRR